MFGAYPLAACPNSKARAAQLQAEIDEDRTFDEDHYGPFQPINSGNEASQVVVIGPDNFMVTMSR